MATKGRRSDGGPFSRWIGSARSRVATGTAGAGDAEHALSKSEIFDVLRNQRRRAVIRFLFDHEGSAQVDTLTEAVAADEVDKPVDELTSAEYKRVYTGLYQCHLERMEELGVISFDRTTQTVELRDPAVQLAGYLPDETQQTWPRLEAAFIAVASVVIVLGAFEFGPLGLLPPVSWTIITVVLLLALGLVHTLEPRPA